MKKMRKGGPQDLNVYTVSLAKAGLLGYATFPASYRDKPSDDGVVLCSYTVPGGSLGGYNTGKILVHEVGHWIGLYHTFQGGCEGNGDEVPDTPAEETPASECKPRDTCPSPGIDSIHNHMNYTPDSCRTEFTPGQIARAKTQFLTYRTLAQ
ncbi:hypothetical protein FRC03_003359 [Tulasnella sp. 419]|nr:hypothetical protein FRC03_003359 [Tulasnella sp. 419]